MYYRNLNVLIASLNKTFPSLDIETSKVTCEITCCHKVLLYVANKFLWFDLRYRLCSRYHVISKLVGKCGIG